MWASIIWFDWLRSSPISIKTGIIFKNINLGLGEVTGGVDNIKKGQKRQVIKCEEVSLIFANIW